VALISGSAASPEVNEPMLEELIKPIELTLIFSVLGLALFALAFWVIVKVTPFSIRKEIEEDHNVALAIIIASMIFGIAIIIAAAVVS
jgi:putative membrane protein